MPEPAYANQVEVSSPTLDDGLRVNHPRLREYIINGIKMGWGNERICAVVGVPASFIDKERAKLKKV